MNPLRLSKFFGASAAVIAACAPLDSTEPELGHASDAIIGVAGHVYSGDERGPVRIANSKGVICTGVVLSNHWVLTAAHCFDDFDVANPGKTSVATGAPPQDIAPDKIIPHPEYKRPPPSEEGIADKWFHDAALVHLSKPISIAGKSSGFSQTLWPLEHKSLLWQELTCYGWGNNRFEDGEEKGKGEGLYFGTFAVDLATDANWLRVTENFLLATARGDSGGPCYFRSPLTGLPELAGIVQGGDSETDTTRLTPVYPLRNWMALTFLGSLSKLTSADFVGGDLTFADLNGNGLSDRIYRLPAAEKVAALNDDGSGALVDDWCYEPGAKVLSGDFDGDGRGDLLCRHGDGTNSVALREADSFAAPSARFSFCKPGSELFAGAFFEGDLAGLMCHDPTTGFNTLLEPDAVQGFDAPLRGSSFAWCGGAPACVKESNKEICFDGVDNDCDGFIDTGCGTSGAGRPSGACRMESTKELCFDGVDNNCDGRIDQGCPGVGVEGLRAVYGGKLVAGDFDSDGRTDLACHESSKRAVHTLPWRDGGFALRLPPAAISGSFCDGAGDQLHAVNLDGKMGDDLVCRSATGGIRASLAGAPSTWLPQPDGSTFPGFKTIDYDNAVLGFCTADGTVQFATLDASGKAAMACVQAITGLELPSMLTDVLSHLPPPPPPAPTPWKPPPPPVCLPGSKACSKRPHFDW